MKRSLKKSLALILTMFMVVGFSSLASAALMFNLDFGQDGTYEDYWEMDVDDEVYINIYVSDVPSDGLISMGMDITYDISQLAVTAGTEVYTSNWYVSPSVDSSTPGSIIMKGGRMYPGLEGDNILLGTIELHCIAPGLSEIWLFDSDGQGGYDDFVLANGTVFDGELADGIKLAEINNVPIPGALVLLGSGLVGLIGLGRRRMKRS
jgi:hypothetical protein